MPTPKEKRTRLACGCLRCPQHVAVDPPHECRMVPAGPPFSRVRIQDGKKQEDREKDYLTLYCERGCGKVQTILARDASSKAEVGDGGKS